MARDITDASPIESRDALVAWFEQGCKPADAVRVGTEHEKIPFFRTNHSPVPFEGSKGIQALLHGMQAKLNWESILDEDRLIGLYDANGGGAISLEPGGQFELSGAPFATIHETASEIDRHLADVAEVAGGLGVGFLALGLSPKWTLAETPVMPKSRYQIMARYMPKVGSRGLDMMFRTATVQANLDFSSEADMVKKLRVGLALQPIATALFANSPFLEGKPNGLLSERSEIWRDTDNQRAGMTPFAFEPGMGFERYVDYALDVPMYFVKRGAHYHDVAGASFRDLLAGRLAALPGERATMSDWVNHLSTIFPEVRLKRYLEMRGADVGPRDRICALPAFFVGLYYDSVALDAAFEVVKAWSAAER
jgi:glutamate--cysteine ligase